MGQAFVQVSQSFRYWKPKFYLYLSYSAGLGITEPDNFGYYLNHTFLGGMSYPFQGKKVWFSTYLAYRHSPFTKVSHDVQGGFWRGAFSANYKFNFTGNIIVWTENKNRGDAYTASMQGKRFYLYSDPQIWYGISKKIAVGSKVTLAYHLFTYENRFQAYPTLAMKYQL